MSTRADDVASADGQPPLAGRAGHLPVESLPGHLDADAERLLIGVSVYREPADRNAVLFQVGMRDWTAARAPDRQGPAPPYQPPADLAGMLATCQASGLLVVASSPGCDATADDWHSVFVEAWLASQLHRLLTAAGRGAELTNAHQRAARYWQWRSAAWPQGRRADLHDLLEARHHLFDSGDGDQASALTEAVCAQLHAWGDLGRETALIHETLDRLPARSAGRAAWIRELGRIAEVRGDHADAERRYQQALDMFATAGDRAGVSRSYHSLGVLAQARGDYSKAERRYLQSAEAADQPGASAAAPSVWPPQDAAAAAAAQAPHPGPAAAVPAAAAAPHALGAEPRRTAAGGASDDLDLAAARWSITRVTASRPAMTPVTMPKAAARRTGAGSTAPRSGVAAPDPPDPPGRPARSPRAPGSPRVPRPARHPRPARPASPVSPASAPVSPASPAAAGHRYRPRRAWRQLPALAATAAGVVALAVAVLSVQLFGVFAGPSGGRSDAGRTGPARPGAVGPGLVPAVRKDAALWVKDQVNRSAIIACDQAMCSALQAQGVPAGSLFALGPGSGDPLASNVVVATTAVRSQFGVRLAAVYAPVVVASFGAGSARIEVRVVAPDGSAAYLGALRTDLLARRSAGAQLLLNRRISVAGLARRQLTAGLVDSRLLMTLAVLARMHALRIVSFSGGPGAGQEVPLPIVEVTGSRPGQSTGYLEPMVTFLHAQRPPFLAASVRAQLLTDGQTALRIDFADPGPLGLLTGGNSAIPITNHK